MLKVVTSLGRTGLQDWIIQRLSAVVLAIYVVVVLAYIFYHPKLDYTTWQALINFPFFRYFTLFTLICLVAHAWIGIWTVTTDYIKRHEIRLTIQVLFFLGLISNLGWGVHILWPFF